MALLARALGKDFLNRRFRPEESTYWVRRPRSGPKAPQQYEQQF
jgi:hypothetical protein